MRKRFSKVLLGKKSERKSARVNQLKSIFTYGKIKVSVGSSKQLVRLVDRLVVRVNGKEALVAKRYLIDNIGNIGLADQILEFSKMALKKRQSGFCTISRLPPRRGDGQEQCYVELIDFIKKEKVVKKLEVAKKAKENAK